MLNFHRLTRPLRGPFSYSIQIYISRVCTLLTIKLDVGLLCFYCAICLFMIVQ